MYKLVKSRIAPVVLTTCIAIAAGSAVVLPKSANAADVEAKPIKAFPPPPELPFFLVNDNRLTYAYRPNATSPGTTDTTAKQIFAFTHFDVWAYGTNFINLSLIKSDRRDPAAPCGDFLRPLTGCAGATEAFGLIRSTFGWNEIFNTKAFTAGPLRNISFEVGVEGETENMFLAPNKRAVAAGLQFAFDLPYKGFFNVAPLYYQVWGHNSFFMPTFAAPFTGVPDGSVSYRPTWAVELNYYMDLGFLPENMQFFSVSGRAGFYGPSGTGAVTGAVAPWNETKMEINSEPIRLTFDASKAFMGPKYSHFVDVWVAYGYWKNKFGLDDGNTTNPVCFNNAGTAAASNNHTCTEKTVYTGVTVKF